jgi:DNA-binding NtrC family response regulator
MSGMPKTRCNRVLLVDSDFRTSQRLAALLGEDGYEVEVARDAPAAMVRLGRAPALDALITELKVPLGDGAAIARYARSQAPGIRVIVLTRYPNLLIPATFGALQPVVLAKPLDYARLLETLKEPPSLADIGAQATSPRF